MNEVPKQTLFAAGRQKNLHQICTQVHSMRRSVIFVRWSCCMCKRSISTPFMFHSDWRFPRHLYKDIALSAITYTYIKGKAMSLERVNFFLGFLGIFFSPVVLYNWGQMGLLLSNSFGTQVYFWSFLANINRLPTEVYDTYTWCKRWTFRLGHWSQYESRSLK